MSAPHIPNSFRYSIDLLNQFSLAAIENARELIEEAELLFEHRHFSRAYFISVVAIEEIGKSFLAFEALGRNLGDSAVTAKLRNSFESHSAKINSAFQASIISHGDLRNELEGIVNLIITLKHGREPSMYTDINYSALTVNCPKEMVREVAAKDCIQLAKHCYFKTREHQQKEIPSSRTSNQDAFFGMKSNKVNSLFDNADFWWFYISNMEAGDSDISNSIANYQRDFLNKGKIFKEE